MLRRSRGRPLDTAAAALLRRLETARFLLAGPVLYAYRLSDQQHLVDADARRWAEVVGIPNDEHCLLRLVYAFPEFRSILYHRLERGNAAGRLAARVASRHWKGVPGLDLSQANAGPGLFISHGQGTILAAERIGANCFVHQGVTVGWDYRADRCPVIGDGVFIGAGAKVLGAVTVGDGARIGANAVVLGDVPAGGCAVGVPARVIGGDGAAGDAVDGRAAGAPAVANGNHP